jgi:hypothetical protein
LDVVVAAAELIATWQAHPVITVREILTRTTTWDQAIDPMTFTAAV